MNKIASAFCMAASIAALHPLAFAQPNDALKALAKSQTGFKIIEQQGEQARAIQDILKNISLPDGFAITLYALAPHARHMAVGPQGMVTFVGTLKSEVWAIIDHDRNGIADEVRNFAPFIEKSVPNGPCFAPDGVLYVAEQNRVLAFPRAESQTQDVNPETSEVIPAGALIPEQFVSSNHTARVCDVGPDNRLYISLGQPYNVTPREYLNTFDEIGIGGIIRINRDGTDREVYALGIRNSVGQDFHPTTGDLWFTDNQVDGMGDDIPPGEINQQTAMGQHFGFPWFGGGHVRTNGYKDEEVPGGVVFPVSETVAHAADLGMLFYQGDMFPDHYRGGIFSAQHGSWNRSVPIGARIMFTPVDAQGRIAGDTEPFAEGWLDKNGKYLGRPVDVAQLKDGSLLISDDRTGAVYRITYAAPGF
ncbi:PQQ-dependent sugar dehydrogenase [Marinobacter arenosus]|uniref:PQQ-dependent sugar dehydrogenase n=1 Tax=Marinobacter arenosus TaxID=2856822 RepID=UPI001C4B1806|nr:PQQ-dependent sugar dehydrogenase [Marinobacter arenosus]MBW0147458.1 PQQ-dependent sugar dehydrogenase [Marinobacter arenosus]